MSTLLWQDHFIEEPYVAYDYSDEDPQDLERLAADVNEEGDVFAHWSAYFPEIDSYYIVLGWFDHNWVSIQEENTAEVEKQNLFLVPSANPFTDCLSIIVHGSTVQTIVSVYDLQGREVASLFPDGQGCFLWDGRSSAGELLPVGTYMVRAESNGISATIRVVKLAE